MDGPKDPQDPSGAAQDPSGGAAGTSKTEPETFTKEQADKRVSDELSKAGRTAKALEAREEAVKAREEEHEERQKQKDEAELERYKDDPEKLDVIKERQENRKEKEQLARERAEHAAEIQAANATKLETTCFGIAQEHGVDASELKDAAVEYKLTSKEQIESLAKRMAKGEPGGKPPATPPLKPMSSKTMGGENWQDLSADEKVRRGLVQK